MTSVKGLHAPSKHACAEKINPTPAAPSYAPFASGSGGINGTSPSAPVGGEVCPDSIAPPPFEAQPAKPNAHTVPKIKRCFIIANSV